MLASYGDPAAMVQRISSTPVPKCTTGCPIIDAVLRGGIACGGITELVGKSHRHGPVAACAYPLLWMPLPCLCLSAHTGACTGT